MGYYKNLLILAQQGDKKAIKTIAQDYEAKKQFKLAMKWYSDAGDPSSVKRLNKLLEASNDSPKSTSA